MIFSSAISEPFTQSDDSIILPIAKAGTLAKGRDGKILRLTEEALSEFAETYAGGRFDVNHVSLEPGTIKRAWYDNGFLMAELIGLSDDAKAVMNSPAYSGVSQECDPIEISGAPDKVRGHDVYDIKKLKGRGVAMMVYPHKPQCPLSEGCGVVVSEEVGVTANGDTREKLYEYDVGRINNLGNVIKTREISIWLFGEDVNNQDVLKERLVSEVGWGQIGTFDIYERDSQLQIGDAIINANPVHTIDIAVSGDVSLKAVTEAVSHEVVTDDENTILHLNTTDNNNQIEIPGGNMTEDTELKALIEAKDAEIASLKTKMDEMEKKLAQNETIQTTTVETAVSAAIESLKKQMAEEAELKEAMESAKTVMSEEVFASFMETKPSASIIKATVNAIRGNSAKPGAVSGQIPKAEEEFVYSNTCELKLNLATGLLE